MEESAEMIRSQRARGLIFHATGTSYELDAARMEESAAMECSEQARGGDQSFDGVCGKYQCSRNSALYRASNQYAE